MPTLFTPTTGFTLAVLCLILYVAVRLAHDTFS